MQAFIALRAAARSKRDKAIDHARHEYEQTLVQIANLEQDLLGRESSRHKLISSCVESVIPQDREFTTVDIMTSLEALDPGRAWRKRSVDNHLARLRERGLIRRTKKHRKTEPAIYVRVGAPVQSRPFEDMELPDVITDVLGGKALTQTELVVAMMEAGYETQMTKSALRDTIGVAMRKEPERFKRDGEKWVSAG